VELVAANAEWVVAALVKASNEAVEGD